MRSIRNLLVTAAKDSTRSRTMQPNNSASVAPFHRSTTHFRPYTPRENFEYEMRELRYIEEKSRKRKVAFGLLCGLFGLGALAVSSSNVKENKNELPTSSVSNTTEEKKKLNNI